MRRNKAMRIRIQTLTFGIVAGCLWSLVPGTLGELYRSEGQVLTVLLAGVVTGVLTSIALSGLLEKSRRVLTLLLGLLALPLGAFLFGI